MSALGLRLQIVLAASGLMTLLIVPLFFAVASLTRAAFFHERESSARALGRAVAAHVAEVHAPDDEALLRTLESHVGDGGVDCVCVFRSSSRVCAGDATDIAAPSVPYGESTKESTDAHGTHVDVTVPASAGEAVLVRLRVDDERARPLVRLVAGYITISALALVFFFYVALTRFIVRPVEALARATDKVAQGARTLDVPMTGARELVELGASVKTMTARLIADEAALRKKVDELTETTRQLTEAQAHLVRSERMASVGRLAAGLAHEIGNPIAAIMGLEDLLLTSDLSPEEQRDFLNRMKGETERINKVLRDLLDFARPEEPPSQSAVVGSANVARVVADVLALARPQKDFKRIAIESDVPDDLDAAITAARLTQVLLNLVLNAGDAMQESKEPVLLIAAMKKDSAVVISVSDTGTGIDPKIADRLFEPFATTKEPGKGTGLGLAVCRGIIESAGGTIVTDPNHEPGVRFVVTLRES